MTDSADAELLLQIGQLTDHHPEIKSDPYKIAYILVYAAGGSGPQSLSPLDR